jgi:hypothetical protein
MPMSHKDLNEIVKGTKRFSKTPVYRPHDLSK